jgi:hypothetical protein
MVSKMLFARMNLLSFLFVSYKLLVSHKNIVNQKRKWARVENGGFLLWSLNLFSTQSHFRFNSAALQNRLPFASLQKIQAHRLGKSYGC